MLSSTPLQSTASLSPRTVYFDPIHVVNRESFALDHVVYDPETGVLVYQQDRELPTQPVLFVFPTVIDGYTVEVESETGTQVVPQGGQITLPALVLYQGTSIEITFTPTTATAKPRKPKFATDIRVRPRGGG